MSKFAVDQVSIANIFFTQTFIPQAQIHSVFSGKPQRKVVLLASLASDLSRFRFRLIRGVRLFVCGKPLSFRLGDRHRLTRGHVVQALNYAAGPGYFHRIDLVTVTQTEYQSRIVDGVVAG